MENFKDSFDNVIIDIFRQCLQSPHFYIQQNYVFFLKVFLCSHLSRKLEMSLMMMSIIRLWILFSLEYLFTINTVSIPFTTTSQYPSLIHLTLLLLSIYLQVQCDTHFKERDNFIYPISQILTQSYNMPFIRISKLQKYHQCFVDAKLERIIEELNDLSSNASTNLQILVLETMFLISKRSDKNINVHFIYCLHW